MNARLKWELNPIIVKELRSRMRGPRAFLTLTAMLVLLGLFSYGLYRLVIAMSRYSSAPISPQIGQTLFAGLVFFELLVICGLTPAVTAGAISGEQEKQTYEMLLTTPLRPGSILWGKLVSALSYIALLVFASVPLASLVFIFGGVTPWEMLKALAVLLTTAVMVGVIGLFNSALFKRTSRATVVSYVVILLLLFAPLFASMAAGMLRQGEPPRWMSVASPIAALVSAIAPAMRADTLMNLFYSVGGGMVGFLLNPPISMQAVPRPLYHYSLPLFGAITLVLYLTATRLVRPVRRWRLNWQEAVGGTALVAAYAGLVIVLYSFTTGVYESPLTLFSPPPTPMMEMMEPAMPGGGGGAPLDAVLTETTPYPPPGEAGATPTESLGAYPGPGVVDLTAANLSENGKAQVYASIIRQIYTVDHTFGERPEIPMIYLLAATDDSAGAPETAKEPEQPIPVELQQEILAFLHSWEGAAEGGPPAPAFRWITARADAPVGEVGRIVEGGAIITLGNIHVQADGSLHVPASIFFGDLVAGGRTYMLEYTGGVWQISGTTGSEWMS